MISAIRNLMDRFFTHRSTSARARASRSTASAHGVEPLEQRLLMAVGPRVIGIFADNRGQVVINMDRPLNRDTVNNYAVQIRVLAGNRYRKVPTTVTYHVKRRQITASAALEADTPYQILLASKRLRGADGARLDGEFNGAKKASGNGRAGGNFVAYANVASQPIARFSTALGNIDVRLFASQTPLTVQNFLRYANATGEDAKYSWDNTFIHRSVKNFVIQGGGFKVNADNKLGIVYQRPAVPNEPFPNNPGNIRGTIAVAKLGNNPNSGTNQWFFNLADNRANLDFQNGGFTVFGKIINKAGLRVMDKIAKLKTYNLDSRNPNTPFTDTPLINGDAVVKRGTLNPARDLVLIRRIAILMDVAAAPSAKAAAVKAAAPIASTQLQTPEDKLVAARTGNSIDTTSAAFARFRSIGVMQLLADKQSLFSSQAI